MTKDDILHERLEDFIDKHNLLCDLLTEMKLNPLADFDSLKIDEVYDEDPEDDPTDDDTEVTDGTGF